MNKQSRNDRVQRARTIIFEETPMDLIYEIIETPDFIEVFGSAGGDALHYRVYDDGTIYAK